MSVMSVLNKSVMIRQTTKEDIRLLCADLRPADRAELRALGYSEDAFASVVEGGLDGVFCLSAFSPGGRIACIFGLESAPKQGGYWPVWLLGTPEIDRYSLLFAKHSKPYVGMLRKSAGAYPIGNYVYAGNRLHIRWLRWLGFHPVRSVTHTRTGERFCFYLLE